MNNETTVWLAPPFGHGEPQQVEAKPELLVPFLVAGWSQCEPPAMNEEVIENVHD